MDVSAVVLSAKPVTLKIPGVAVVPFVSRFSSAAGLLAARLAALERVQTTWFFFLDDDDELPNDYKRVLKRCMKVNTPLAYTDEVITQDSGAVWRRRGAPYSEEDFISNPTLIHHLAVCKTEYALRAAREIPRGVYMVENLLFFQVAKGGATYIDDIGYIWHRRSYGLNRHPSVIIGMVQSQIWANRNRTPTT